MARKHSRSRKHQSQQNKDNKNNALIRASLARMEEYMGLFPALRDEIDRIKVTEFLNNLNPLSDKQCFEKYLKDTFNFYTTTDEGLEYVQQYVNTHPHLYNRYKNVIVLEIPNMGGFVLPIDKPNSITIN